MKRTISSITVFLLLVSMIISAGFSGIGAIAAYADNVPDNALNDIVLVSGQQVLSNGRLNDNDLFWRTELFPVYAGQKILTNIYGRWNFYKSESISDKTLVESFLVNESAFGSVVNVPENEGIRFAACSSKRTPSDEAYIYWSEHIPSAYLLERIEKIEKYLNETSRKAVPDTWGRANSLARAEQLFGLRWEPLLPLTDNCIGDAFSPNSQNLLKYFSEYKYDTNEDGKIVISYRNSGISQNIPYSSARGHDRCRIRC